MAFSSEADDKPTVSKVIGEFGEPFCKACEGNDITGQFTGSMLRLLKEDNVPPHHQVKARIILAACREDSESWEAKFRIRKVEEAFKVAKRTYVHDPLDVGRHLTFLEESIEGERAALREYEWKFLENLGCR